MSREMLRDLLLITRCRGEQAAPRRLGLRGHAPPRAARDALGQREVRA